MGNRYKKALLLLTVFFALMLGSSLAVRADVFVEDVARNISRDGNWKYAKAGDFHGMDLQDWEITNLLYVGSEDIVRLEIPETVDGFQVKGIMLIFKYGQPEKLVIPNGIETIVTEPGEENCIRYISVENQNPYFFSKDGVLYSKKRGTAEQTLYWYPSQKKSKAYEVLEGTAGIKWWAFSKYTKELTFPGSIKNFGDRVYEGRPENNIEKIVIRKGIQSIDRHAFGGYRNLKRIEIPSSVKKMEGDVFAGCRKLKKMVWRSRAVPELVVKKKDITGESGKKVSHRKSLISVPKSCKVYVQNEKVKRQLQKAGCQGKIVVK